MSVRPLDVPIIATNADYASGPDAGNPTKNAPSLALLQDGWRPEDEPDAREWNHVENAQSRAIAYLDAIDVSNLHAATHDWDTGFGFANVPSIASPYCIGYRYPGEIVVVGGSAGASSAAVSRNDGRHWYEENLPVTDPVRGVAFVGADTAAAEAGFLVTSGTEAAFWTPGGGWTLTSPAGQLIGAGVIAAPGAASPLFSFGGDAAGPAVWRSSGGAATACTVPALAGYVMRVMAWGGVGAGSSTSMRSAATAGASAGRRGPPPCPRLRRRRGSMRATRWCSSSLSGAASA